MAIKKKQKVKTAPRRANKQAAARSADARRKKKRRQGRRTLYHILVFLFLLAAGVILSLTFFFKIETVNVVGADRYDPLEIALSTGIQEGDNLFRVPLKQVEEHLLRTFPYIESAKVRRALPPSIEIEVTQSIPAGVIVQEEEHILITKDGKVLDRGLILIPSDVMLVKGIHVADRKPGEYLGTWNKENALSKDETKDQAAARAMRNEAAKAQAQQEAEALVMLTYLFDAIEKTGFPHVSNVDLTDRLNMQVVYENRLVFKLGSEADLESKLRFIQIALESLHPMAHGQIDAADVRNGQLTYIADEGYLNDGSPIGSTGAENAEN